MKKIHKDVILLFIYSISNTIYFTWSVIYPYLASYMKHYDSDITMKKVFSTTSGLFIGIILGNLILPKFYFIFGIKTTIQIGGFLNLLNCIFYYSFTSLWCIFLNVIFTGMINQLGTLSITYYLSEKYKEGYKYSSFALIGQNVANIIWPFIAVYIMNPRNLEMTEAFLKDEDQTYFPWEISKYFPQLMKIMGIFSLMITILPSIHLEDPSHIESHFALWFSAVVLRSKKALAVLEKAYKFSKTQKSTEENLSIFIMADEGDKQDGNNKRFKSERFNELSNIVDVQEVNHICLVSDKEKSSSEEEEISEEKIKNHNLIKIHKFPKLNKTISITNQNKKFLKKANKKISKHSFQKELSHEQAKKKTIKLLKNPFIIFLMLFFTLRNSPLFYYVDNYKIIAYSVIKNDQLITTALCVGSFISIFGQLLIKKLWEKLGFYYCHILIQGLTILMIIIYLFFSIHSSDFMFWNISFDRFIIQLNYGSIYFTKFGLFNPKVAVLLSQFIDLNYFLAMLLSIVLNFLFFSQQDLATIFVIFFVLNVFSTFLFIFKYKHFDREI